MNGECWSGIAPWIGGSRKLPRWGKIWAEAWGRKVPALYLARQKVFQMEETKHSASSEQHSARSDSTFLISLLSPETQMVPLRSTPLPLSTQPFTSCFSTGHALLHCPHNTLAPQHTGPLHPVHHPHNCSFWPFGCQTRLHVPAQRQLLLGCIF